MKNFTQKFLFVICCVLVTASGYAQRQQVTGVVTDSSGPVIGATVIIDGTTTGVSTNLDGEYSITASADQTLVFSYLGYTTQSVAVGARTNIDVQLVEDAEVLEDVVVVGYGTMRRSDVTGAIASVDPDELLVTPSGSVGDMLRGRAAGVTVTSTSGRPGSAPDILIRGTRSLDGSNTPLYVVDGVPVTSTEFGAINGNDIASLEILKDAAAQSIYGARASNGVVLVTTKRGKAGDTTVTFDSYIGFNSLWRNFDLYSADEWYEYRAYAQANDWGKTPDELTYEEVLQDAMMQEAYANGESVDWEDIMLRDYSVTQKYDIGISGGSDKLRASFNAGFFDQQGIARYDSGYKRGNFRLNVDYEAKDWLKIGVNASYVITQQQREDGSLTEFITRTPWAICYNEDGSVSPTINSSGNTNPLYDALNYDRQITSDRYRVNPFIEFKPFEGFSYKLNASFSSYFDEDGVYYSSEYYGGGSNGSLEMEKDINYLLENIINYQVPIKNNDHKLGFTGVISYDRDLDRALSIEANNVPVDLTDGWNFLTDGENTAMDRTYSESLLVSYMLRANYSLKDKYIFTAAFRRDGSSKFGENNKWGNFPSASVAWRIDQEPFMRGYQNLDNLKLRVSWGQVGNQGGIGNYTTLGTADSYDMDFAGNYALGYLPSESLSNPDLKWETTTTTNIGIDFGAYNNRIMVTAEYFDSSTTDLLVTRSINSALGYTSMLCNLGETASRGIELSVSGDIIRSKDFNWNATVNFTKSVNEIITIDGSIDETTGEYADNIGNLWFIGESINVYYDYDFAGIYQLDDFDYNETTGKYTLKNTIDTTGDGEADTALYRSDSPQPGDVKLNDVNGDGVIDENDRIVIDQDPNFIMSLSSTMTWKGFDLFADFYYQNGGTIYNRFLCEYNYGGTMGAALNGIKRDYWTVDNPSNTCPAPTRDYSPSYMSSLAYQDQTYFRLRTLSLGYSLPNHMLEKMNFSKFRVYVTGTNIFTKTDVLSYSPELVASSYPETRSWVVGVNLAF